MPARRAKHRHLEDDEQRALFLWAAWAAPRYPELGLMFAIPNGGKRDPREAARMQGQGVKSGVPDICLPVPRRGFGALYIEMKAGKNKPTADQNKWLEQLEKAGNMTACCWGWDQAKTLIMKYLTPSAT